MPVARGSTSLAAPRERLPARRVVAVVGALIVVHPVDVALRGSADAVVVVVPAVIGARKTAPLIRARSVVRITAIPGHRRAVFTDGTAVATRITGPTVVVIIHIPVVGIATRGSGETFGGVAPGAGGTARLVRQIPAARTATRTRDTNACALALSGADVLTGGSGVLPSAVCTALLRLGPAAGALTGRADALTTSRDASVIGYRAIGSRPIT